MKKCACRKESCLARKRPKLGNTVLLAPSEFLRIFALAFFGEMSEWSNEHAWKVCILETVSRVRIPLSPLSTVRNCSKVCKSLIYTLFLFFEISQMFAFDRQLGFLLVTPFQKSKRGNKCANTCEHNRTENQRSNLVLAKEVK